VSDELDWLQGEAEPFAGETSWSPQAWEESALADRDVFDQSLRNAGLPSADIREALELRDDVASQAELWDRQIDEFRERTKDVRDFGTRPQVRKMTRQRNSVIDRLRDWFGGRSVRVDASEEVELRIPLFVLAAAEVPGCTASVETQQERGGGLEWGITIFGTGLGGSAQVTVASSSKFSAASGEIKVVFLPASVTVEKVTMLDDGREVGHGHRVDASRLEKTGALGLRLLPEGMIPPLGALAERFPLAEDTTGAVASYEYTYARSGNGDLSVGVQAFGTGLRLKATVELSESITVAYGLAAGVDYELHQLAEGYGLLWAPVRS
jgi:hypothetical protein